MRRLSPNRWLLLILALALILRLATLHLRAPGIDEHFTLSWITAPDILSPLITEGFTPPLYYLLTFGILQVTGSVYALSLFSVFLGMGSLTFLYLFTKRTLGTPTALIATALLAILPLHIFYSQHMRTYALTFFLFSALLYFIHDYTITRKKSSLFILAALNTLLLYTSYVNIVIVGSEFLYFLYLWRRGFRIRQYIASLIVPPLLLTPWLLMVVGNTLPQSGWAIFDGVTLSYLVYKMMVGIDISTLLSLNGLLLVAFPLVCIAALSGLITLIKEKKELILAFLFLPLVLAIVISFVQPIVHFRFLSFLVIPLSIILARSIQGSHKKKRILLLLIIATFWLSFDILYFGISQTPEWNELIGL